MQLSSDCFPHSAPLPPYCPQGQFIASSPSLFPQEQQILQLSSDCFPHSAPLPPYCPQGQFIASSPSLFPQEQQILQLSSDCFPHSAPLPPYCPQGQFIASSPSLFPDEYVLEFQKCLDKTEPVPFSVIERIINQVGGGAGLGGA